MLSMHPIVFGDLCLPVLDRNFWDKPPKRVYPQYYKQISHPTALTDIKKMAEKGSFQTWPAFIEEVRYIWDNAKDFNEEGSPIYEFAEALEVKLITIFGLPLISDTPTGLV